MYLGRVPQYEYHLSSPLCGPRPASPKGAAHELNPTPSPVPLSRPLATLRPLSLSVGPCRPTLG
ncbi:hypothetical protein PISMIDRAFT_17272 [Pisolithus microcarpus 441]|uniref:Uncharacterized protein n=1 Tax=Pisolithus microcarpus 441 TaxID=765257 RepID=A0A0C9Z373_9AGAM|nr:hypothetical protein PISMIDRAFT_17272 [Pisolithus microcarpus 441]